jgi:hypothetical protein
MKEITADLWMQLCDVRCVTTNGTITNIGRGVMGRGVAREAKDRYPGVEAHLGRMLRRFGNHTMLLVEAAPDRIPLVAIPVKHEWHQRADLLLVKRSIEELVALTEKQGWQNVMLPRPGCGNGQQKWEDVERIVRPLLDDRFTVVYRGTGKYWQA